MVLAFACVVMVYGVYVATHAKLDVFPDFVQPQAVVQTEAPGLSPEQVEALVTRPVEGAVSGVPFLESVRSQSIQGLSIVTVVFNEGTDILTARQMLAEQIGAVAGELPDGVQPPRLTPLTSATMDLLKLGLVSDRRSLMELRSFADWTLRPRLQAVPGVAQVGIMGGDIRQLQIQIDPERLLARGLSFNDITEAARRATGALGAGFMETANQRLVVQTEGQSLTAAEFGEVLVSQSNGSITRLKDVARVTEATAPKFGDALIQGRPGVLLKVLSQYGSNTMEVTEAVEAALAEMQPVFAAEEIQVYPRLHRPATFIETALHHVRTALLLGGLLVVAVLLLFLFNLRTAFISILAIPLSLLIAVIVVHWLGMTLNTITLGGLAIAIGEVVDDAIIDVENIFRRLRERADLSDRKSVLRVVGDASLEIRSAVVYATFVVVLVFVPVLTMSGLQGRMFAPLGIAYIAAILASLVVALTVTPALCCLLLPGIADRARTPAFLTLLKAGYERVLARLMPHRATIVALGVCLCLAAVAMLRSLGQEFLPAFREGHFVLQVNALPGTGLGEMMRLGKLISNDLLAHVTVDGERVIDTVEQQAGRAELGEDPWGPHRCEIHVELKPDVSGADQAAVQDQIRGVLANYPGITSEVLTFLGDRIGETLTGETASVVIDIFGDDLDALDETAREISGTVSQVRGAADVRVASPPGVPQLLIHLRRERLQQFGFRPLEVLAVIQTAYQGTRVAQTYEGNKVFDVVVILEPALRRAPETVGSLLLRNDAGTYVPLRELADLDSRTGRYMVMHNGARRRQAVTCNVSGRDVAGFVADAKAAVSALALPPGTYLTFGGAAEAVETARNEVLLHAGIVGFGILLLLATVFRNAPNLLLVLANLPFAFVGGVLAVFLTGRTLSIGSIVGFVTLFGITMRNSVMIISHLEHLVTQEGMTWGLRTVLRGAGERIVPILMTALVTGLGLLPIAWGAGEVGREIEGPMAIVILGGLITSTVLNLLVLPAFALRFGRFECQTSG